MKVVVRSVIIFLLLACLSVLITTIIKGYMASLNLFITSIHVEFYAEKIHTLLSEKLFHLIQLVILLPILFLSFLLYYFNKFYTYLTFYSADFYNSIGFTYKNIATTKGKYILILPIIVSIYLAITIPVSYDEALTYFYFTSKSIFTSISYYPVPNNHVLNSVITNLTSHIPFSTILFNLRISSIILNALMWVFAFSFLTKYFNKNFALIVVAIASTLFFSIYYSYMARGYGLLDLCFITGLYFTFNIINGGNTNRNWFWFSVSCILGFYTIPSFLYPYLTLNVLIVFNNYSALKKQFKSNIAIVTGTVILYIPVVVVSGLNALISNQYVKPISRGEVIKNLPAFFSGTLEEISGFSWIFIALLLAASLFFLIFKRNKRSLLIFLVFITMPPLLLLTHSVIPFGRTFSYYTFIIVCLLFLPWASWLNKLKPVYLLPVLLVIQLALIYNFNSKIEEYEEYSFISKKVIQQMDVRTNKITSDAERFNILLLFEVSTKNLKREIVQCYDGKISADTINNRDFIILEPWVDETKVKNPRIITKYFSVY